MSSYTEKNQILLYETNSLKIYNSLESEEISNIQVSSSITAEIKGILHDFEPILDGWRSYYGIWYLVKYWTFYEIEAIRRLDVVAQYDNGLIHIFVEKTDGTEKYRDALKSYVSSTLSARTDGINVQNYRWLLYF